MKKLQHFFGFVTEIDQDTFTCRMNDITNPENPEIIFEFYKSVISKHELTCLQENRYIHFFVRTYEKEDKEGYTVFRFERRYWTQEMIDKINKEWRGVYKELWNEAPVI